MRTLLLAALLAAGAVLAADTAEPAPTKPPSVLSYSRILLGSPAVSKELGLDNSQESAAEGIASAYRNSILARLKAKKPPAEKEADIEKEMAFLKPEQRLRLRQITLQRLAGRDGQASILLGDKAVLERLKPDPAQKKKLEAGAPLRPLLDAGQRKEWAAMTGAPFLHESLRSAEGLPETLQYLLAKPVAEELSLTPAQNAILVELVEAWRWQADGQARLRGKELAEARKLEARLDRDALALLLPAQRKRLGQIRNQAMLSGLSPSRSVKRPHLVFASPLMATLGLDAAQAKRIAATLAERQEGLLKLFAKAPAYHQLQEQVEAAHQQTREMLEKLLKPAQREKLAELLGKPFDGADELDIAPPFPPMTEAPLKPALGRWAFYGESEELHKELGLSAEQRAEYRCAASSWLEKETALAIPWLGRRKAGTNPFDRPGESPRAKAARLEKELLAFLKPGQVRRLKEVLIQQVRTSRLPVDRLPSWITQRGPEGILEVAEALALSAAQKAKLAEGVPLPKVLDAKQEARWRALIGKPLAAPLKLTFGSFGNRSKLYEADLAASPDVAKELRLTDAQKKKMAEAGDAYRKATGGRPGGLSPFGKPPTEADKAAQEAIGKALDDGQRRRLAEIKRQQARKTSLRALLDLPDVKQALALDAETRRGLLLLEICRDDSLRLLLEEFPSAGKKADPARKAIRDAFDKGVPDSLSVAKMASLTKLLGKPFTGTAPRFVPRFVLSMDR